MLSLGQRIIILVVGIAVLIITISIISVFIIPEESDNDDNGDDKNDYEKFIDKVDSSVKYVLDNTGEELVDYIDYPKDMNVTVNAGSIVFDYREDGEVEQVVKSYSGTLHQKEFKDMSSGMYKLGVKIDGCCVNITFTEL